MKNLAPEILYLGAVSGLGHVAVCGFEKFLCNIIFYRLKNAIFYQKEKIRITELFLGVQSQRVAREKFGSVSFLPHNYECQKYKLNFVWYFVKSAFPEMHENNF